MKRYEDWEKKYDTGKKEKSYRMGISASCNAADLLDEFLPHDSGIYPVSEIRYGGKFELQRVFKLYKDSKRFYF